MTDDDSRDKARLYDTLRLFSPRQYETLWQANIRGVGTFDELVRRVADERAETGNDLEYCIDIACFGDAT